MINCALVTVNYYSEDNILKLLNSIAEAEISSFTLIIVDSSLSFKLSLPKNFKDKVKIIRLPENRGYAYAANVGLRTALNLNPKYMWLLNPDVLLDKNSFKFLKETSDNEKNSLIGSTVLSKNKDTNDIRIWGVGGFWDVNGDVSMGRSGEEVLENNSNIKEEILDCNYVPGCSIFLKPETLKKIGYIPEDYFLYYEETAWALNSNRKFNTKNIIDQRSIIYHEVYESKLKEDYRVYFYNRNSLLFKKELALGFINSAKIILKVIKKLIGAGYAYYKAPAQSKHIFLAHVYSALDFLRFLFIKEDSSKLKISKKRLKQLKS